MKTKTRCYDFIQLTPPSNKPMWAQNLEDISNKPYPTIIIPKDTFEQYTNRYKIMVEFIAEILDNKDFTCWHMLDWYARREYNEKT